MESSFGVMDCAVYIVGVRIGKTLQQPVYRFKFRAGCKYHIVFYAQKYMFCSHDSKECSTKHPKQCLAKWCRYS